MKTRVQTCRVAFMHKLSRSLVPSFVHHYTVRPLVRSITYMVACYAFSTRFGLAIGTPLDIRER